MTGAMRLTAMARAQAAISASTIGAIGSSVPALLMTMPMPPNASLARRSACFTSASSATSQAIASALPPAAAMLAATASSKPRLRAISATGWPSWAKCRAAAAPMPRLSPVLKKGRGVGMTLISADPYEDLARRRHGEKLSGAKRSGCRWISAVRPSTSLGMRHFSSCHHQSPLTLSAREARSRRAQDALAASYAFARVLAAMALDALACGGEGGGDRFHLIRRGALMALAEHSARPTRAGLSLREPRSPIYGSRAMIVSGHAAASAAGIAIHRRGGNAVDAMIAASATLAVVLGHATSIGGDCF